MLEISQRGIQMPASPIRKLAPLSDAAQAEGVKVYHLNIGQPDMPTPKEALDAIKSIDRTTLEYSPSDGYKFYRENLVKYYKSFNIQSLNGVVYFFMSFQFYLIIGYKVYISVMKNKK